MLEIKVEVGPVDLGTVIGEKRGAYNYQDEEYEPGAPLTLGDAVVDTVADKLFGALKNSEETKTVRQRIAAIRDEEIRSHVAPIVEAAISQGIQQTNGYGEPVGKATTLRDLIIKEVHAYIGKRADSSYRNSTTLLDQWLQGEIDKALKAELATVLADEKAKIVAAVRAKGAELLTEAVKQGVGVR